MYKKPEMHVEQFEVEDVITTSGTETPKDPEVTLDNFEMPMLTSII